jgi:transcriptional regulator with XRE-family HTH domain
MQGHHYSLVVPLQLALDRSRAVPITSDLPEIRMDSLGGRLRYERERRQIALKSIAESTKIGAALLDGLERDDVSRWPSGIFRKSFVKAYAEAIGLDPDPIVREFVERFPDPLEVDLAASAAARSIPANIVCRADLSAEALAAKAEAPSGAKAGPLSIKLTITWSGSVLHTIGRLVDWKIVRLLSDRRGVIAGFKSERI